MQKHKKSILALFLIASLCVSVLGAGTAYTRSTALDEEGTNQVSYSSQNLEENDTVYMLMTDRFFDGNSSNSLLSSPTPSAPLSRSSGRSSVPAILA